MFWFSRGFLSNCSKAVDKLTRQLIQKVIPGVIIFDSAVHLSKAYIEICSSAKEPFKGIFYNDSIIRCNKQKKKFIGDQFIDVIDDCNWRDEIVTKNLLTKNQLFVFLDQFRR